MKPTKKDIAKTLEVLKYFDPIVGNIVNVSDEIGWDDMQMLGLGFDNLIRLFETEDPEEYLARELKEFLESNKESEDEE